MIKGDKVKSAMRSMNKLLSEFRGGWGMLYKMRSSRASQKAFNFVLITKIGRVLLYREEKTQ